jgi:small subunit ribosomal protein S17
MTVETVEAGHGETGCERARARRRVRTGVVQSDKADKTISVRIDRLVRHPKYGKLLKRTTVLQAHDERNEARQGDRVEITECRPISKTKSWRLSKRLTQRD